MPEKQIGGVELVVFGFIDNVQPPKLLQSGKTAVHPQFRLRGSVDNLQVLRGVFDVHYSAGAVFHVRLSRRHQLPRLPSAQMQSILQIQRRSAVSERVPSALDLKPQTLISRHPAQFNQRLPFKSSRLPLNAVVPGELIEGSGPCAGVAIGPQPQIDMKNSHAARFNKVDHLPRQLFKERIGTIVNEEKLEVRRVAHFAAAEFPPPANRVLTFAAVRSAV